MQWFLENWKPFILSSKERARVIPAPRPERPREQRSNRSTSASTGSRRSTSAASSSGTTAPQSEGPSTEPMTPIPPAFTHSSSSTFHAMGPPSEGLLIDVFGSYTSMMSGSSNVPTQFYHSPPMFLTSVPPLVVYPPPGSEFGFNYGWYSNPTFKSRTYAFAVIFILVASIIYLSHEFVFQNMDLSREDILSSPTFFSAIKTESGCDSGDWGLGIEQALWLHSLRFGKMKDSG
ncbi:hypothetical protein V6N13_100952 [Hibiscus sabdariffa]